MQKNLVILGATGSIGTATLDVVVRHPGQFNIRALAAYANIELLEEQYRRFHPEILCVIEAEKAKSLARRLKDEPVEVLVGEEALLQLPAMPDVDIVVNAVVGAAGLRASLETVRHGRNLALANKESLVVGGPLFPSICQETGAKILPIDSEHSAIWQAMMAGNESEVRKIILTSSGGPFRELPADQFEHITVEQALNHPTWNMGPKITIDSATLANKGLEVIEAVILFSTSVDNIEVVVHPQSIIHSMVEFCDSSIMAQLSLPDMRLPITYALFWPDRAESDFGRIDWRELSGLTFETPDLKRFPTLRLACDVARSGGAAPAVFNAANEIAVQAFLDRQIKFVEIPEIIERTLDNVEFTGDLDLDTILETDRRARETARTVMEKLAC